MDIVVGARGFGSWCGARCEELLGGQLSAQADVARKSARPAHHGGEGVKIRGGGVGGILLMM